MGTDEWVHFTGRVPDELLWRYLATADLCVDPDPLTEWSNLSTMNKIIEYMAFGKPIVAFDLAEHRRSAGDAAAYVKPNNDIELGVAIRDLLLDDKRRRAMGLSGQNRFCTDLAWEESEKVLVRMYSELLGPTSLGYSCSTASLSTEG